LQRLLDATLAEYAIVLDTERRFGTTIDELKRQALDLNRHEIEYSRLKRERDNNLALFELVLKRHKEADLTLLLKANNIRPLEEAKPPRAPVRPKVFINLLLALAFGVAFGLGLAFLIDHLDNTVKSQKDVEEVLGLPFLGVLPALRDERKQKLADLLERDQFVAKHPRSVAAELCRTIRTNLLFMSPEKPLSRLLVTSAGPREGKSTLVGNLAVTIAQSGKRALLIDTDMRRPRLHHSFGLKNDIGITNILLGDATPEQACRDVGIEGLHVLTCGPIPPNPAELLHTERFRQIVNELAARYDWLLFDSPPVGVVTDAQVLAAVVDGIIQVVDTGRTSLQQAQVAKRRLHDVGANLLGVVLNNVDLARRDVGSYYESYQYYYYRRYDADEGDDAAT
jgi:capsular exopolysaccharide synthesis family protein